MSAWIWDLVLLGFDFLVYECGILAPRIGIWGLNLEIRSPESQICRLDSEVLSPGSGNGNVKSAM